MRWLAAGAGCFLLVIGVLLPLYVYPRLAVLPHDPQQQQLLSASGASVLVPDAAAPAGARVLSGVDVTISNYVAAAPGAQGHDVVWDLATRIDVAGRGMLNAQVERISLDPRTAEPTNCCGDRIVTSLDKADGQPLSHRGYVAWPFDVQKHSYSLWNVNLRRARTADYVGTGTRYGIGVYEFRSTVPLQRIGTAELPGGLFSLKDPSVIAESWYSDARTYWIEPETGNVLGLSENLTQQYTYGGRTVTAFKALLESPRPSKDQLSDARRGALVFRWLRGRASVVLVLLGLVLLVVAVLIGPYAGRRRIKQRSPARGEAR